MSTLSVAIIRDVQSFDFSNTEFAKAYNVANASFASANASYAAQNVVFAVANASYNASNSNWTVTNTVYGVANASFGKANTALQNTSGTFAGNLSVTGNLDLSLSTSYVKMPVGTTAQRPSAPSAGHMRFNSTTSAAEYYNGTVWITLGQLDGSTPGLAAPSASYIYNLGIRTSTLYWLQPPGWSYPAQFYCEMSKGGGGWIYVMQRYLSGDQGMPYSWCSGASGTPNHASSNFYGVVDGNGNSKSVQDIWDAFVGSSNNGKVYAREIFTNGSYDEWQYYVDSSDNAIFSKTNFLKMFYGNFPTTYGASSPIAGTIKVYYNNGASTATGQYFCGWGNSGTLGTINNGNVDGASFFCNGEDGVDGNWMFGLGRSGSPFPGSASYTGGSRTSVTRYGIMAIKA